MSLGLGQALDCIVMVCNGLARYQCLAWHDMDWLGIGGEGTRIVVSHGCGACVIHRARELCKHLLGALLTPQPLSPGALILRMTIVLFSAQWQHRGRRRCRLLPRSTMVSPVELQFLTRHCTRDMSPHSSPPSKVGRCLSQGASTVYTTEPQTTPSSSHSPPDNLRPPST